MLLRHGLCLRFGGDTMPRRSKARAEDAIQRTVFQHFRQRSAPGVVAWHTPSGGYRKPVEAAIFKGLGVMPGVSDILAVRPAACQCGRSHLDFFALELKAAGGRATEAQMEYIHRINAAGGYGVVAFGLDEALRCLEAWGLLKGRAS